MADAVIDPGSENAGPVGFGGWLIVPLVGFAGAILVNGWSVVRTFASQDGVRLIFDRDNEIFAPLRLSLGISFLGELALIVSASLCLYLAFTRRRAIVPLAISHYVILAVSGVVNVWSENRVVEAMYGMARDPATARAAIVGVAAAAIWGPYFAVSKRVRNTFVEPSSPSPAPRPIASADLNS